MKEKGITLIALVITIIVMIILVGVTVTIATNGGLFDYAGQASASQRAAMVEEHVSVWKSEKLMAKYAGGSVKSASELLDDLYSQDLITEAEKEEAKTTGIIKIRNKEIAIKSDGKTIVELYNEGKIKIGDYLDYEAPEGKSYVSKADKTGTSTDQTFTTNNNLKWQVLGIDSKTGGIKLVADGFATKKDDSTDKLVLQGAKGYVYGVDEINNICAMYKNDFVVEARSINLSDFNEVTGVTEEWLKTNLSADKTTTLKPAELGTDFYTPERFLNGGNPEESYTRENGYVYWSRYSGTGAPQLTTSTDDVKNGLLIGKRSELYWLAVQFARSGTKANFGIFTTHLGGPSGSIGAMGGEGYIFNSDKTESSYAAGVRPVVVLDKLATEEDLNFGITKVTPGENLSDWTYEVDAKTNTITITGYHGNAETVTIPNYINDVRVTKIQGKEKTISSGYSFTAGSSIWERAICVDKYYNSISSCVNETVKKVIIPEGIEEIGAHAFEFSINLAEVVIQDSTNGVKAIGEWAFYGCGSLASIKIPSSVTSIGNYVFAECKNHSKFEMNVPFKENKVPRGYSEYWNYGRFSPNNSSTYKLTVNYAQ